MTGVLIKKEDSWFVSCLIGEFPLHQETINILTELNEGDKIEFYLHHEINKKFAKIIHNVVNYAVLK